MITFGKTATKPNYLFGKLPYYFKEKDNYKDGDDEGLLERYLQIFCAEIDGEVSPYIDSLLELKDAEALTTFPHDDPTKFLIHIAEDLGNPPDIGTDAQYIILLRHIRAIFQTKGTLKCLELFLAIYGYCIYNLSQSSITLEHYDETPTPIKYDDGAVYDHGFTFYSNWDLVIADYPGTTMKFPSVSWLALLKEAIQTFITPIFATLNTITYLETSRGISRGRSIVLGNCIDQP